MNPHSTPESPAPERPWLPLLMIFASLLTAGLLCSDALTRLAPAPDVADSEVQPGIALVGDSVSALDDAAHDPLVVVPPADSTVAADPVDDAVMDEAVVDSVVEVAAVESAPAPESNGNTNPHAHPNGHTNNAQNGNGNGIGHGRP